MYQILCRWLHHSLHFTVRFWIIAVAMHDWRDFVLTVFASWFVFQEVENLSQQLSESKRALEEESEKVRELVMTNNSLKDLVTNTQEALDKEQNIVKSYTETSPNGKVWQWWQMCSDSQISFDFLWDLSLLYPRILERISEPYLEFLGFCFLLPVYLAKAKTAL